MQVTSSSFWVRSFSASFFGTPHFSAMQDALSGATLSPFLSSLGQSIPYIFRIELNQKHRHDSQVASGLPEWLAREKKKPSSVAPRHI